MIILSVDIVIYSLIKCHKDHDNYILKIYIYIYIFKIIVYIYISRIV